MPQPTLMGVVHPAPGSSDTPEKHPHKYTLIQPFTAEYLASLLSKEFEAEDWGDINPDLFRRIASNDYGISNDAKVLRDLLVRVCRKLNSSR